MLELPKHSWRVPVVVARVSLLAIVLGGCAVTLSQQTRYAGPAPACAGGGGTTATLVRSRTSFAFAPTDGALVVNGTVARDGTLTGTLALHPAQAAPGAPVAATQSAKTPQVISVSGRLSEDSASVAYAAPGCQAQVTLTRVHKALF
jgi:hypothetical protein